MSFYRLFAASGIVQVVGMALTLVLGVLLARFLGPTEYGIYGVAMAAAAILAIVAQFGLPLLAYREAARPGTDHTRLLRWLIGRVTITSLITIVPILAVLLILRPSWAEQRTALLFATGLFVLILSIESVAIPVYRSANRNLAGQAIDMVGRPIVAVLAIAVLVLSERLNPSTTMLSQITAVTVCFLIAAYGVRRRTSDAPFKPAERWVASSSTYMINALLGAINSNYPMLIAGWFASGEDLGVLRVALSAAIVVNLPGSVANIAMVPVVAREASSGDEAALANTLSHTTLATFAATAAAMCVLAIFGHDLIRILFGAAYVGAQFPLLIAGMGQLVISAFGISGSYLNLTGREGLVVKAFLISVPVGILSSLLLAAKFGILGSVAGMVIMPLLWHAFIFLWHGRSIDVPLSLIAALRHVVR